MFGEMEKLKWKSKETEFHLQVTNLGEFENADLSKHDLKDQYDWKTSKIVLCTL